MKPWSVYIVRCCDNTLYTGIATDVERRGTEHNQDNRKGARYTRSRRPVILVYRETCESRAAATRREHQIRQLGKAGKEQLIQNATN